MFAKTKIAVIGAGKLGEALIGGMIDAGIVKKDQFIATAAHGIPGASISFHDFPVRFPQPINAP